MLANDLKPNRLEQARRVILDLLPRLAGDRIGLISFAGAAYTEVPLTGDVSTFRLFVDNLSPDLVPIPGTNLEAAVEKSVELLVGKGLPTERQSSSEKMLILITDGEALSGELAQAIELAASKKIIVHSIGLGTAGGSPIPLEGGLKKDLTGKVVFSKLDRSGIQELSARTNGLYTELPGQGGEIGALYRNGIATRRTADSTKSNSTVTQWNEYFQLPLFVALLALIASSLLPRYARQRIPMLLILLLACSIESAFAQTTEHTAQTAANALRDGDLARALELFSSLNKENPEDLRLQLGEATALYRLKRYRDAEQAFLATGANTNYSKNSADTPLRAEALFGAGNAASQLGDLEAAAKHYEESLKLVPDDTEAKENLELVRKANQSSAISSSVASSVASSESSAVSSSVSSSATSSSTDSSSAESASASSASDKSPSDSSGDNSSGVSTSATTSGAASENSASQGSSPDKGAGENPSSANQSALASSAGDNQGEALSSSGSSSSQSPLEQLQSLLDNIQEDNRGLIEFRRQRAGEISKEQRDRDW